MFPQSWCFLARAVSKFPKSGYLESFLSEILRTNPPAPFSMRLVREPLEAGRTIDDGKRKVFEPVILSPWQAGQALSGSVQGSGMSWGLGRHYSAVRLVAGLWSWWKPIRSWNFWRTAGVTGQFWATSVDDGDLKMQIRQRFVDLVQTHANPRFD